MKWTEAQRAAIELRDKNILVSAAAGSGKTAVLVERMKRLILEEGVSLNEMLMVTFSNAAAAEMKGKIVVAIEKEMETNKEDQRFLRKQLGMIYKANISTFHGFAMEVIRRYFHLIGVEPNVKICDEGQKTILQAEAMDQLFSELFQAKDPDFFDFLQHFSGSKNENAVKDMIYEVHGFIQSVPKPFEWLSQQVEALSRSCEEFLNSGAGIEWKEWVGDDLELVDSYLQQVQEMLELAGLPELAKKSQLDLNGVVLLRENLEFHGLEESLDQLRTFSFQRFVAKKEEKEGYNEIKEEVTALRERAKSIFKKIGEGMGTGALADCVSQLQCTYPQARFLERAVREFDGIYKEKKEKKGVMDFSDMEHFALDILEQEEAAREYRNKFRYIFIDEYQDSNVVQETLIDCIRRENNVFMVGDVKQSIYKFRLAEPELFLHKYERYKNGDGIRDCKVDLNCNFRSKKEIIFGINHLFQKIMNRKTTGMDYDEQAALHVGLSNEEMYDYPIALHLLDDAVSEEMAVDDEIAEMKRMEVEAYAAARILKESYGKTIYDAKKGCERKATYGDMVVLLRSVKTTGQLYFQSLTDAGIPCFADHSDGYFDTIEIQVFLNLLRVIDNGSQDLPLLSVLRSVIFHFDLEELAAIRIQARTVPYYRALQMYEEKGTDFTLKQKVKETLEKLCLWRSQATYLPLEDFLWKLLQETGYQQFVSAIPGGQQRRANLKALVDKAVQYQSTQMKGLFGFIRYIEALQTQKVSTAEVRLIGEHDDVVRIMTIHKSKGLEFPIVLVGGLGKRLGGGRELATVALHRDLGLALRLVEPTLQIYSKTVLQSLIERRKKKDDMAEEIRILYVAFTRAMDQLILLGSVADLDGWQGQWRGETLMDVTAAKSYLDLILPALDGGNFCKVIHDRSEMSVDKTKESGEKEGLRKALEQGFAVEELTADWKKEISRRFRYQYPYENRGKVKSKYTVSELVQMEHNRKSMDKRGEERGEAGKEGSTGITRCPSPEHDVALLTPQFLVKQHSFTQAEKGSILHRVMECVPFSEFRHVEDRMTIEEKVEKLTAQMVEKEMLTEEQRKAVSLKPVVDFLLSDLGKRSCASEEVHKETPFNLKLEVDGQEALVQGVIDCYFKEADGYVLLDYKSNHSSLQVEAFEAQLREWYTPQLQIYCRALKEIGKMKVKESYLYSFALGRAIAIEAQPGSSKE